MQEENRKTCGSKLVLTGNQCTYNRRDWEFPTRYTVISPGYKIPGYFSELSSGEFTAQFKNFTTARMQRHMHGFQWPFGVIFPSQDTMWSIILFTMYYFTAINIFLSLHYTEILNSIIIPSIPYGTEHGRLGVFHWEPPNSEKRQIHNKH